MTRSRYPVSTPPRATRWLLLALLSQWGCGGRPPTPVGPAAPSVEPTGRPVERTLTAVVLVDGRQRKVPGHLALMRGRLSALSEAMTEQFGLALAEGGIVELPTFDGPTETLDDTLVGLEGILGRQAAPLPQGDLYIAFVGDPPPARPTIRDMVASRYGGRIVVVRSLSAQFSPQEPERRLGAERVLMLRGVGRVFGALDACGPYIMGRQPPLAWASPDRRPVSWHPANRRLVEVHQALEFPRAGAQARVPKEVAESAGTLLRARLPEAITRCDHATLDRRRALLARLAAAEPEEATPPAPPPAAPEADPALAEGLAALDRGESARAFDLCNPVAERDPAGEAPRCAGLAAEALDRPEEAIPLLRAHLSHHPADDKVMLVLARLIGRNGDDGAARALLEGFVTRNPDSLKARLNLGVAYARLGRYDDARAQWQAVLSRDPENASARKLLEGLP